MAAGAAYQTRKWPNRALYGSLRGRAGPACSRSATRTSRARSGPSTRASSRWSLSYIEGISHPAASPRKRGAASPRTPAPEPIRRAARFRSNIPSRRNLPFVGRDDLLDRIGDGFARPGARKRSWSSTASRAWARASWPGSSRAAGDGTRAAGSSSRPASRRSPSTSPASARTCSTWTCRADMPLEDHASAPVRARRRADLADLRQCAGRGRRRLPWLPPAGMPCHVLMTTTLDRWDAGWMALPVPPLSPTEVGGFDRAHRGAEVAARSGRSWRQLAEGLPVQIVPASATLAYEARRGRLDAASITLTEEAQTSSWASTSSWRRRLSCSCTRRRG